MEEVLCKRMVDIDDDEPWHLSWIRKMQRSRGDWTITRVVGVEGGYSTEGKSGQIMLRE